MARSQIAIKGVLKVIMPPTLKHPTTWLPVALSLIVIAAFLIGIALNGPPMREPDEGVGAHLFQIWLLVEFLMIAFFALTRLSQQPKQGILILTLQIIAVIAACFPVYYFRL